MQLPEVVNKINKDFKTTKITTLDKAKAFRLKRFFSGSFGTDYITGGGFAYRRIQLLFGAKSSGKNALLNQTAAYMQRMCRNCHGVLSKYLKDAVIPTDNHTFVLKKIMGHGTCACEMPEPKKILILDYERALAIEEARDIKIPRYIDIKTDAEIDGLDYSDATAFIAQMGTKEKITDGDREKIKKYEALLKGTKVEEKVIRQLATTDYLIKCGIFTEELLVADPEDTEEGIEIVKDMVKAKEVDLIIWDSLQAAIPRYVKDRDADQATMGVEAKQNGLLMRHVCSAFAAADLTDESEAYKPALMITSQVRASLGGFVSGPDSYSGGNALAHHISLALEVKREKFLRADGTEAAFEDEFFGQSIRVRAEKNKLSSPGDLYKYDYFFREGENFPIGIDTVGELTNLGIKLGLIERAGAYYTVGKQKFQGISNLKAYIRANPEVVNKLYLEIMSKK